MSLFSSILAKTGTILRNSTVQQCLNIQTFQSTKICNLSSLTCNHRTQFVLNKNQHQNATVSKISILSTVLSSNLHTTALLSNDYKLFQAFDKRITKNGGTFKKLKKRPSKMFGRPQIKGVVLRILVRKPRKPNSANRKCCSVRLSNGKIITAHIPGEGHTLQEHNVVLIEGGKTQDLFAVHHKVVRGKFDCAHVVKSEM